MMHNLPPAYPDKLAFGSSDFPHRIAHQGLRHVCTLDLNKIINLN